MLYPELFKQLESVRWDMARDIPWDSFDAAQLSDEQAQTVKMNAITEWAALPATEMFLREHHYTTFIPGHTHLPARHEHCIDGRIVERWVLADWHEDRGEVLCFDGTQLARQAL